jgi:hypothetical protein
MAIVSLVDNAAQGKSVASKAAWIDLVAAEAGILRPPPAIAVILRCFGLTRGKKGRARKKSRSKQLPHRLNFLVPWQRLAVLEMFAIPAGTAGYRRCAGAGCSLLTCTVDLICLHDSWRT